MKNITKKRALLFALFLLTGAPYTLHAAKSVYQPIIQLQKRDDATRLPTTKRKLFVHGYCRAYNIPTDICFVITCLLYNNPLRYRNKSLPSDLSGKDLSGFDFTGCAFTYTNLSYTDLTDVILTNTICDYQKAFQDNIEKNKIYGGVWYQNNLPNDLKSIAVVYPKLKNNTHKAKLLHIACGLSRLPFYEETEFYIKVAYWSFSLLQLKKALSNPYGNLLVCSLKGYLQEDENDYCWKTKYLQNKVNIAIRATHANFDRYLKDFTNGLTKYQCKSEDSYGFDWYKDNIIKNIEGLQEAYPMIIEKQLQQAACDIAHALSKSYQIQKHAFKNHYLFFQNRLINLKKSVDVEVKDKIHYSEDLSIMYVLSWRRGERWML